MTTNDYFNDADGAILPPYSCPLAVEVADRVGLIFFALFVLGSLIVLAIGRLEAGLTWAVLAVGLGFTVWELFAEAWEYQQRLSHVALEARANLRFGGDEKLMERYAQKHFLQILGAQDETRKEFQRVLADHRWIAYCRNNLAAGGSVVLQWYAEPMQLLRSALNYDSQVSWSDWRRRKLVEELSALRVRNLTEAQLELEQERLRAKLDGEQNPPFPWETGG